MKPKMSHDNLEVKPCDLCDIEPIIMNYVSIPSFEGYKDKIRLACVNGAFKAVLNPDYKGESDFPEFKYKCELGTCYRGTKWAHKSNLEELKKEWNDLVTVREKWVGFKDLPFARDIKK